jgi:glycosyltransferase involved in cell wall biosynthesis
MVIVPFGNIYPPMNGGMHRCINILNQLAKYFSVTAIIHQDEKSFLRAIDEYPELVNCRVISTKSFKRSFDLFSLAPKKIGNALHYRYWNRSLKGKAGSDFLSIYPLLKNELKKQQFDCFILEDMSILNLAKVIRRFQPKARIIYDAYNVNTKLAEAASKKGKAGKEKYLEIKKAESSLSLFVTEVFTCSNEDLNELADMNNKKISGTVIPNGVKIDSKFLENREETSATNNNIIFCGSMDYFPNQEGLIWFCKEVFPFILKKNPQVKLMVVGKGDTGDELNSLLKHDSIIFFGMVDDVNDYYKKAAVAIVPLLSGSGTRLKLLEAMGRKTAVVSTVAGAEGINCTNEKNVLIADDNISFANAVIKLLDNRSLAGSIATAAYSFVKENYDWNVVGGKLNLCLNKN